MRQIQSMSGLHKPRIIAHQQEKTSTQELQTIMFRSSRHRNRGSRNIEILPLAHTPKINKGSELFQEYGKK